jgi:hypothetical protein
MIHFFGCAHRRSSRCRAEGKPHGTLLTFRTSYRQRNSPCNRRALEPCWGKPPYESLKEEDENVGIIGSPVGAIILLDATEGGEGEGRPTSQKLGTINA